MHDTLLKIRETNIHLRMDIPSSSLTVRISSWKWAFQPCKISIWIWSHLSFVDQIHIRRSKNDLFQRDILTAKDVCFIVTRTDIYLTYDDGGRPFSNGNPSWLECSFSGRYPYCEGGWRNIHPRLVVRLSVFLLYYVLNGYPSWLEWLFAGRYPYCDGGSRNIHPTPFPPVTGGYSGQGQRGEYLPAILPRDYVSNWWEWLD